MAYGLKAFRKLQISNVEGTPGTAEAAVEVLYGTASIPYGDRKIHYPEQERGLLSRNMADDFVVGKEVEGSIEMALNSRHAVWLFCNAIAGNVTATRPNSVLQPLAYYWLIQPSLTAANTPDIAAGIDTFTLEFGDNTQAYETEYVFTRRLEITGAPNEPVMVNWEWTGRQITETTFTTLVALPVQYYTSNTCKFYIDAAWATIGNTEKSCAIQGWTWTLETQFTPRYGANGQLYFCGLNEDRKNAELKLIFYRDSTISEGEKDKYLANSTTYIRLHMLGTTEIDAGQANVPYVMIDGSYRYTEWPEPDDSDGTVTEEVTLQSVYDSTGASEYIVRVYNDMNVYPS